MPMPIPVRFAATLPAAAPATAPPSACQALTAALTAAAKALSGGKLRTAFGPWRATSYRFYDSFDWRLYRAGTLLVLEPHNDLSDGAPAARFCWRTLTGETRASWPQRDRQAQPRVISEPELGPGRQQRLAELLKPRALLEQAVLAYRARSFCLFDSGDKVIVRGAIECHPPSAGHDIAPWQLYLEPVEGYQTPATAFLTALSERLPLTPLPATLLEPALAASRRQPNSYSNKIGLRLAPTLRSDQGTKIILRRLLDIMRHNEAGVQANLDSEFLHDYRVAVRRTRTALGQIKQVFPVTTTERYRNGFAWLGAITGPTRDLDVYLLQFTDYKNLLSPSQADALTPLLQFIKHRQQYEHTCLIQTMKLSRYRHLLDGWEAFLTTPVPARPSAQNAARPLPELARQRIWRAYRKMRRQGAVITSATAPEALHELRKSGKKLRYLLEFFHSLFDEAEIKPLIKALKQLQNVLGDFQDYQVQSEQLRRFAEALQNPRKDIAAPKPVPAATLMAIGSLSDLLRQRQQQSRAAFADTFEHFARPEFKQRYRALFKFD